MVNTTEAHVCVNGTDYVCKVDPMLPNAEFQVGHRVLCNEAYAVVKIMGFDRNGPIMRIDELLSDGRIRIGQEGGGASVVIERSDLLGKEKLKPGMDIRLDMNQRVALEVIGVGKRVERSLETVSELPWSEVGGQDEALQAIRDTIEMPFLHRDLFKRFDTSPRDFCCMVLPAAARPCWAKRRPTICDNKFKKRRGVDHPEFFLHVKGPRF